MSTKSYISCIKIGGIPIIPPLITPEIRSQCLEYKLKAVEREKNKQRKRLFKQCLDDLERLEHKTKDLSVQTTIENQLVFEESSQTTTKNQSVFNESSQTIIENPLFGEEPSPVPSNTYKKMLNLTSETIEVSEYRDDGVKMIDKINESTPKTEKIIPPKLIRSNSYTLESPSPILLAHLEREARKCVEIDDYEESDSASPVTIIDSELEPLEILETDISIQKVIVNTPEKPNLDPALIEILDKLPQDHAKHILEILSKQEECNKRIKEQIEDDKSISVSISSQSLYFSTLSPDTTRESPNELNLINLKNSKNRKFNKDQAATIITAYARGFLVRRLIRTERVQGLINTIKDAILCAVQLHDADVIEEADVELHRRLIQQVSAACYAFHDIFFTLSIKEQMGIIALDRQRKIDKANRPLSATSSNLSLSRRQTPRMIK